MSGTFLADQSVSTLYANGLTSIYSDQHQICEILNLGPISANMLAFLRSNAGRSRDTRYHSL
jgi:hypothetical protein